jgi:methyl-accepting chemotaxis protein
MPAWLNVFACRSARIEKLEAKARQMKEWYDSAMVMVENVPAGVAWSDPGQDFAVSYVNGSGKATLARFNADAGTKPEGRRLADLFPPLAQRHQDLVAGAADPVRLRVTGGTIALDLQVIAIRSADGGHIGSMAVWTDVTREAQLAATFKDNVKSVVEDVAAGTSRIGNMIRDLVGMVDAAHGRSAQVADATATTSQNVQTVAASAEQLAAAVTEIGREVERASAAAADARDEVSGTTEIVRKLSDTTARIGGIVGIIQEVANRTNLLALNATIEAARAGQAGKGFAVVATEVKGLATQTTKATEEIRAQVDGIQGVVESVVRTIERIGARTEESSTIAAAIAASVEQQNAATRSIAESAAYAASGTSSAAADITEVSRALTAADSTSGQVLTSATDLQQRSDYLRRAVDDFVAIVSPAAA